MKSFTKVAEKNFVAQSMISKSIKKIEKYFGAELVKRAKFSKEVEFTPKGEIVYGFAKELKIQSEKLVSILEEKDEKDKIKIGYTEGFGNECIMKYVSILISEEMKISEFIEIIEDKKEMLEAKLERGELDFILIYYLNSIKCEEKTKRILLKKVDLDVYAKKGYKQGIKDINILNDKVIVSLKDGALHYDLTNEIIEKNKIVPKRIIRINDLDMLLELIATGVGMGILCKSSAEEREGIEALGIDCGMKLEVCLEYFKNKSLSCKEKMIIDKIKEV